MTSTSSTPITLSPTTTRQIADMLTVCDDLIRTNRTSLRTALARSLPAGDFRADEAALFIDLLGFTALHLADQLDPRADTDHDDQSDHDGADDE